MVNSRLLPKKIVWYRVTVHWKVRTNKSIGPDFQSELQDISQADDLTAFMHAFTSLERTYVTHLYCLIDVCIGPLLSRKDLCPNEWTTPAFGRIKTILHQHRQACSSIVAKTPEHWWNNLVN